MKPILDGAMATVRYETRSRHLKERCLQAEIMDQPDLDTSEHERALHGLRRVNALSFSHTAFWPSIVRRAKTINARDDRPVCVLDLACGAGDVGRRLAHRAVRNDLPIRITGWDISHTAVALASEQAKTEELDNVHYAQADVLHDPLPTNFDVIMCSLFLHHLEKQQTIDLLKKMAAATQGDLLVNDLRRTKLGYWLAWFGCRLLTRSPVVHNDGPISVEGAYTLDEIAGMADDAGLNGVRLSRRWPERFLLAWSRS